jgi:hypothetical protein
VIHIVSRVPSVVGPGSATCWATALSAGEVGDFRGAVYFAQVIDGLTVTCLLRDGSYVGAHLVLADADSALRRMNRLIRGRRVVALHFAGRLAGGNRAALSVMNKVVDRLHADWNDIEHPPLWPTCEPNRAGSFVVTLSPDESDDD